LEAAIQSTTASDTPAVESTTLAKVISNVATAKVIIETVVKGMAAEDGAGLREAERLSKKLKGQNENFRYSLFHYIKRLQASHKSASKLYINVFQYEEELVQSTLALASSCRDYVRNVHSPMDQNQAEKLESMASQMGSYLSMIIQTLESQDFSEATFKRVLEQRDELQDRIDALINHQTQGIKDSKYGARNSMMVFTMLMEFKDIATACAKFVKVYHRDERKAFKAMAGDTSGLTGE
jgi:hypothetical protein